jgi:cytochrome c-type biogenesis protein CcmF
MFDFAIGDCGHLFVITSFISSLIATIAYFKASQASPLYKQTYSKEFISWNNFARWSFFLHAFSVLGVVVTLFSIIYGHRYEYHYAWSHSSNSLPWYYMISCFWEGQEGSFLLWIFWHVTLGLILIAVNKTWEAPLMAVFCLVQTFLVSMIIGVVIPGLEIKIGSSPFILLKEYMGNLPVYSINPNFVPKDGTGLNPLLQNYWMVIHPPTLFLGFASTIVPFAYMMAGLWQKQYKEWVRPALPWALFASVVLGTGILMGGYWAYETLNFGGYWNWDPVENAVYVPWLMLIASVHTMISYRSSSSALAASVIMVATMYLLILYSTFLTRSGILGESSVHSFTDLGLSGQLLIYLGTFVILVFVLIFFSWKNIPITEKEESVYSREFWIFIGVAILSVSAFQVIYITSIPVYNAILGVFGIESRLAPPADPMETYSFWQIGFAIAIVILSGIGQFFWWQKVDNKKLWNSVSIPLILAFLITSIILLSGWIGWMDIKIDKPSYILVLLASMFSLFSNLSIFFNVVKNNYRLTGGAIAHIGVALMLLGILFSSGYSNTISLNTSGLLYSKQLSNEQNAENILLFRNDPQRMKEFSLRYKGPRLEAKDFPGYLNKDYLIQLENPELTVAKRDIEYDGEIYYKKGDTIKISPENTYYEVEYTKAGGDTFNLFPRLQKNKKMGSIASPDIKRFAGRDLYSHLSMVPVEDEEREWSETEEHIVKQGDTLFINDYVTILDEMERLTSLPAIPLAPDDIAIKAHIRILGKEGKTYSLHPVYVIKISEKGMVGIVPDINEDLGIRIALLSIDPKTESFTLGVNTSQKDYIVLKVVEKPLINILWLGTFLLVIGMIMAIVRRYQEFKMMRDKGQEV